MKSIEELRKIAEYNPETGDITWCRRSPDDFSCAENERTRVSSRWNKLRAGKVAGAVNSRGYRLLFIERKNYPAHRVAWALHYGAWPEGQIDHINHNKDDNRIENLRDVTASENSRNRSLPKSSSSGAIGVHFHKPSGMWHARIYHDGQRVHLGAFPEKRDAMDARNAASAAHGFHSNHGAI